MIKEFKEFIMRGSVLDLAVGVVIGSAFTAIVTQVVEGLITPLISLIFVLTTGKRAPTMHWVPLSIKSKALNSILVA